jgi:cellulose synthase/poly-beta-1,6-N-acetylglucosamine synthase-like glycosyltransferase
LLLIAFVVCIAYGCACLWLCWQWLKITQLPQDSVILSNEVLISVVVPVRNEAATIGKLLTDLSKQGLLKHNFEVIVVNDASTDRTVEVVTSHELFKASDCRHTLLSLPDLPTTTAPKKRAIAEALKIAKGRWIVTTDGDCRVGVYWLKNIVSTFRQTHAKLISGPVVIAPLRGFFDIFQTIEFSSLIGTGGCMMAAGQPTMCNGANLAYERAVFDEVNGFEGTDHIASGDDELLLQKIAKLYPTQIVFLKNADNIVVTNPQPTLGAFYSQRVRWSSKWAVNRRAATMSVAIFVFLVNVLVILLGGLWLIDVLPTIDFLGLFALKLIPEFVFLSLMMSFFNKNHMIIFVPIVQFIYPFYVVVFGIAAQRKGYQWKNRNLE